MLKEQIYKGKDVWELSNEKIRIRVIPSLGGKMVNLTRLEDGFEYLFQNKDEYYRTPEKYASFAEFSPSGYDDCFPSIDEGYLNLNQLKILLPDHGEVWSTPMAVTGKDEKSIQMRFYSSILSYSFSKEYTICNDGVKISYHIENTGSYDLPCFYTMHCLLRYEADMVLQYPSETSEILNVMNHEKLGEKGHIHGFPIGENRYDFRKVGQCNEPDMRKYYVNGKVHEGYCKVHYPESNASIAFSYDQDKLPYLGVWITEGGFSGDYNIAMEPTSGFYDSMEEAQKHKKLNTIPPSESFDFEIMMSLE